jgi:NDP-4-keto-2,6-dideoxyhexose 3-C-methyltransferase
MHCRIERCRICGNTELVEVLDLGIQALTGVFPRTRDEPVTRGPLKLVKCTGGGRACGLLQLEHSYDGSEMYGQNYGYRSGLNPSMVSHLQQKVSKILQWVTPARGDLILDIGSNDGTTLRAYPPGPYELVGIDPTGAKFREFYPAHVTLIPDFFSAQKVQDRFGAKKAGIITSFSMFYDLEDPQSFVRDIAEVLDENGVWVFEQSYMPTMLERNSYDTVCHEHLEYYALRQIQWLAQSAGLVLLDVELNDINGGSFSIVAGKRGGRFQPTPAVAALAAREAELQLETLEPYRQFAARTRQCREGLLDFLRRGGSSGRRVCGLGASTKGNVILQYCGIDERILPKIGEVNADKFGCVTPGSHIPIVSQDALLAEKPDYLLVLPWHFRAFFEGSEKLSGRRLVFPLPEVETVVVQ